MTDEHEELSDEELREKLVESRTAIAVANRQLDEHRSDLDAAYLELAQDEGFLRDMRAKAWIERGGRVVADTERGGYTELPDGWPDGVDPESYVSDYLDQHREQHQVDDEHDDDQGGALSERFRNLLQ